MSQTGTPHAFAKPLPVYAMFGSAPKRLTL